MRTYDGACIVDVPVTAKRDASLRLRASTRTPQRGGFGSLPVKARAYVAGILVLAALALALAWSAGTDTDVDPALLAVAAVICGAANLLEIFMPGHWSFQPNLLFFFAGAMLLPPWAIAALAVACFAPGYVVNRSKRPESFPWYKVAFNVANYLLAGLAAREIAYAGGAMPAAADSDVTAVLALAGAAVAFAAINHLLIVLAVWLAGERSLRTTARQLADGLPLDSALCLTGAAFAVMWDIAPALAILAPGPALLVYRALATPLLARRTEELSDDVGVLQAALLPALPERLGELELSVAYRPAEGPGAGGDFYDAFPLGDGATAIVLGDVSGHGRDAIERSALMRYTLRAYLEAGLEPRTALKVGGRVLSAGSGETFTTVVLGVHDPEAGTLTYASAGHPAPLVTGPGSHEPVTVASSPPVGVDVPTGLRQTTVALPAGSVACFFTDGLVEARLDGRPLGRDGLAQRLAQLGEHPDALELVGDLADEAGTARDDMAACMIRALSGEATGDARVEELECTADELLGSLPERFLRACGLPDDEVATALDAARSSAPNSERGAVLRVRFGETGAGLDVMAPRRTPGDRLARRRVARRPGTPVGAARRAAQPGDAEPATGAEL